MGKRAHNTSLSFMMLYPHPHRAVCPPGTCGRVEGGRVKCVDAGAGFWSAGGSSAPDTDDADALGTCVRCPAGLTTSSAGAKQRLRATAASQCTVPPGYYYVAAAKTVVPCQRGQYRAGHSPPAQPRSRSCDKCVTGSTTKRTGAASRAECTGRLDSSHSRVAVCSATWPPAWGCSSAGAPPCMALCSVALSVPTASRHACHTPGAELMPGFFLVRAATAAVNTSLPSSEPGSEADYIMEAAQCPQDTYFEGGNALVSECRPCGNGLFTDYPGATGPDECCACLLSALALALPSACCLYFGVLFCCSLHHVATSSQK
jgi:Tyrosine-protein kinase ephrin type A/B receptor-like